MNNHIFCRTIDSDFKLEKIHTCPNYDEEFVEQMGKQSYYWKTRKLVPFSLDKDLYLSKINIFDEVHKANCDSPKELYEQLERDLIKKAEDSFFELLKIDNPGIPDEVIYSFIRMYIGFEMSLTREPETRSNVIRVTPSWKPIDLIDFDCKESKIITDYFLKE